MTFSDRFILVKKILKTTEPKTNVGNYYLLVVHPGILLTYHNFANFINVSSSRRNAAHLKATSGDEGTEQNLLGFLSLQRIM